MTVRDLLERMTSEEFSEWFEFWQLEAAERKTDAPEAERANAEDDGD